MIYRVFSVLGLAGAAGERSAGLGSVVTLLHTAWFLQGWAVSGRWHRPPLARTVMATAHTGHTRLPSAMWCAGFVLKSGTRLPRSKEAVSEQPQESKLNFFLSRLHVSVTKWLEQSHHCFIAPITPLRTGV